MGGGISQPSFSKKIELVDKTYRLPREVWVAGITRDGLEEETPEERLKKAEKVHEKYW